MELADVLDPTVLAPAFAGVATIVLAAWLLILDFESRLHRVFAVFLTIRGLATFGTGLVHVDEWNAFWAAVTAYFGIALPFAALYFAHVYRVQRAGAKPRPYVLPVLVVVALLLEALYLGDHALFSSHGAANEVIFGPLFVLVGLVYVVYAIIANVMVRDYLRVEPALRKRSVLVAGIAFGLICVHSGVFLLLVSPFDLPGERESAPPGAGPPVPAILAGLLLVLSAIAMIPVALRLLRDSRQNPREQSTRRAAWILVLPVATALLGILGILVSNAFALGLTQVFDAAWTLVFALLVVYALVRHRLFDIDVRMRLTLRRTTLAAFFVAAFFIGTELTQNYLSTRYDSVVGVLAAGTLLLALHPLQRVADRLARVAVPNATPISGMSHPEHVALYREQVLIAWADGTLSAKERRMLDRTRERLGISLDESAKIESDIVRGLIPA
ncbi:MAG TPA: histidine kinase N-terminal 7TM domain-containing protein [Candidatus Thermoplasmatota archaeon]|nr:histidine kinase N-terminal 7TM domain-containing protein [Candidatus Thermoplasmatota archaeon]